MEVHIKMDVDKYSSISFIDTRADPYNNIFFGVIHTTLDKETTNNAFSRLKNISSLSQTFQVSPGKNSPEIAFNWTPIIPS